MSNKKYYYYPPNTPQFYFPIEDFKTYSGYYMPYTVKAKLFWFLFKSSPIFRTMFTIQEKDIPLQVNKIKNLLNLENSTLFFNLGTIGPEQKATIIADNKKEKLFLKFAKKKQAKELVKNETSMLIELQKINKLQTANIISYDNNNEFAYLITDVITGKKYSDTTKINDEIFSYLINLAKIKAIPNTEFKEIFSHGDFCPWNMLIEYKTNNLVLIDWEMAGLKPLGYDLFTFIFQTNFLLNPNKNRNTIINENKVYINKYFNTFKIKKWESYLIKFTELKLKTEKGKKSSFLYTKYFELLNYNGKN